MRNKFYLKGLFLALVCVGLAIFVYNYKLYQNSIANVDGAFGIPKSDSEIANQKLKLLFFEEHPIYMNMAIESFLREKNNSKERRGEVISILVSMKIAPNPFANSLINLLNEKEDFLRASVGWRLGLVKEDKVFNALLTAWGRESAINVKIVLGQALMKFKDARSISAFEGDLQNNNKAIRGICLIALYSITKEKKYEREIYEALRKWSKGERQMLVVTLGESGNTEMKKFLEFSLKDKEPTIVSLAKDQISQMK